MAIGEDNILEGLDLSVLDNISQNPKAEEKQAETAGEETKTEQEDPGIFNPELKIQEVDELPETEVKEETSEEEKTDEPQAENTEEDTEEQVSETTEASDTEEESEEDNSAFRAFAEIQRDSGLIDFKDDEFEASEDWLLNKVKETVDSKVDE